MSCKICGRGACAAYMHSLEEQERFDARQQMTDNVDALRQQVQELEDYKKGAEERIKVLELNCELLTETITILKHD
jgi:hypothetical protein